MVSGGLRTTALLTVALLLGAPSPTPGRLPTKGLDAHRGSTVGDDVFGLWADRAREAALQARAQYVGDAPARQPEFRRAAACREAAGRWVMGGEDGSCPAGIDEAMTINCAEEQYQQPLWRRLPAGAAEWTAWQQIDAGGCGAGRPVLTVEDFRRLPLAPPVLILQPDRGWVLVNIETIVRTERVEQTFHTDLAGYGVEVVATPERFHYEFGDGTDLWTTSAGHPYPDHDTFRVYEQTGTYQVTLTTEWSGRYRIEGDDTWYPVTGTAQTSTTSAPFEVVERRSRLVDDLCTDVPKPDDC